MCHIFLENEVLSGQFEKVVSGQVLSVQFDA
jgi:hypothetical protein